MPALMALISGADTVELKLTVPESGQRSASSRSAWTRCDAQIRQVCFLETPDLALDKAGLVVRARRSQKKGDDSVVKLRPVVPSELPAAPQVADVRRRGRRLADGVRLLGLDEGRAGRRRARGDARRIADPQAVLEAAAGAVRGARARGLSSTT